MRNNLTLAAMMMLLIALSGGCPPEPNHPEPVKIIAQPANWTGNPGADAIMAVETNQPAVVEWLKNGRAITDNGRIQGTKTKVLQIGDVREADEGKFQAQVVKGGCSGTWLLSQPAYLKVNDPVAISQQPTSETVEAGANVSFQVSATGEEPIAYQWLKNGSDIGGATANIYTINNVQKSDEGDYACSVSNMVNTVASNTATLTVNVSFYTLDLSTEGNGNVIVEPTGPNYLPGAKATLTATPETGWQFKEWRGDASGSLNPLEIIMDGNKAVTAIFQEIALLPEFTIQPIASITVNEGQPVGLSAKAVNGAISYQWLKDDESISGATGEQLVISTAANEGIEGVYTCIAANAVGSTPSNASVVYVAGLPTLRLEYSDNNPQTIWTNFDANSQALNNFLVNALPSGVGYDYLADSLRNAQFLIAFQYWNSDGWEDLAKENEEIVLKQNSISNTMLFEGDNCLNGANELRPPLDLAANGSYLPNGDFELGAYYLFFEIRYLDDNSEWVYRIFNNSEIRVLLNGNAVARRDDDYLLRLGQAGAPTLPVITRQPISQTVAVGQTAEFSIALAESKRPVVYNWLLNNMEIWGANRGQLTIADAQVANAGQYACLVTNAYGYVQSNEATLTVGGQSDNGLKFLSEPGDWQGNPGATATFTAVVEYTGPGPLEFQWFLNSRPLTDNSRISGSQTDTLTISDISENDESGYYQCGVRIPGLGTPVKSQVIKK